MPRKSSAGGSSSSARRTKQPPAEASKRKGKGGVRKPDDDSTDEDDDYDSSTSSSTSSVAAPGAATSGSGAKAGDGSERDAAGWSVGPLTSFRALWAKLGRDQERGDEGGASSSRKRTGGIEAPLVQPPHPLPLQRELFRRKVGAGSVVIEAADSRSAVALYDRLSRREQAQQQVQTQQQQQQQQQSQQQLQQQRELDEHRLLLMQLRARGL
jgi:hypothetical protein